MKNIALAIMFVLGFAATSASAFAENSWPFNATNFDNRYTVTNPPEDSCGA